MPILIAEQASATNLFDRILDWANVASSWELGLVIFGIFAQCLFFGRWLVQWIATEKRGESHVPEVFWWMSLSGASLLFVYFLLRGEPVGLLGQSIGWAVYSRNLYLIRRKRKAAMHDVACASCGYDKGPKPGDKCPACGEVWLP